MINWLASMQQTYEYFIVDPATWKDLRQVHTVKDCTISRESSESTLGSATMNTTEVLDECYVRVYLVAIQNGVKERVALGTFLVETPSVNFDGKAFSITMDAYTPLIELKHRKPPIGYAIPKGKSTMSVASSLCRENLRAPVVPTTSSDTLQSDFVADIDESWLSFISDLISSAKYKFGLDEMGRILFKPDQDMRSLRSKWTYDDSNCSILFPDISDKRDLFDIPNVVEVVYSKGVGYGYSRIVNDDPNSIVSTVNRGYEKMYRETNPRFTGVPTQSEIDEYAKQLLRELSCLEHTITYTHGYCPVTVDDCVTFNHKRAGLVNIKAKIVSQSIKCSTGCQVQETAVYTTKLWG